MRFQMDSNAPGPLLGYTIQLPRALVHLLKSGPGDVVCVEVLGDVATLKSDSQLITEEDKSSINSNPLTDRSSDLWKTFYNWIMDIISGKINIQKTTFILYANKSGRSGIVNAFDSATTKKEACSAISKAMEKLKDIDNNHDIWKYYDFAVNKNKNLLKKVIQKFELEIGTGAGYEEIEYELKRQHIHENQIQFFLENISGWLQKEVTTNIAAKQPANIKWEDFHKHFKVLFEQARRLELIDFTLWNPIDESVIKQEMKIRPRYLKQLEAIDCTVDDTLEAVSDFLRAEVNRFKWIESEIIDETIADDFQERLLTFWKNSKKRIKLTQSNLNEIDQGQLLLLECKNRDEKIRDVSPPTVTITGTYHALANKPVLGWHPNWVNLFNNKKDD